MTKSKISKTWPIAQATTARRIVAASSAGAGYAPGTDSGGAAVRCMLCPYVGSVVARPVVVPPVTIGRGCGGTKVRKYRFGGAALPTGSRPVGMTLTGWGSPQGDGE